jgi:hypothetical protein
MFIHLFQLDCCGNNNYSDWELVFNSTSLPMSCCSPSHAAVGKDECNINSELLHREGCLKRFGAFVMDHAAMLGGAGIGIAFIQVNYFTLQDVLQKQIFVYLIKRFS